MSARAIPPARSPSPTVVPRKLDLFATFVLALTVGAIASQVFVIIWLSSRGLR